MKLLAVDTATEACSVALWLDGEVRERHAVVVREHAARLPEMLAGLLADCGVSLAQLDGIVCGVGPGSFAGVRVGVGFVKGLALGLGRPVAGVSSLAMLAQGAIRRHGAARVLAAIDARMNEVYFGVYEADQGLARLRGEEVVAPPAGLPGDWSGAYAAAGSGWQAYGEALRGRLAVQFSSMEGEALPHAVDALALAAPEFAAGRVLDGAALLPVYLRNRVALTKAEQEAARKGGPPG
jgi:tRNA threonylcarbamoyladenosine biosynthesis protein TsaB